MSLHLVTGHKGEAHITAEDQGGFNAAVLGNVEAIFTTGERLRASAVTPETVRIYDGELIMQGRHVRISKNPGYVDVPIENGTQDMNRNDLIVVRYTKDELGFENAEFAVLKGVPSSGTAADPTPTRGDLLSEKCVLHEMPLYRVKLNGINVEGVELVAETMESISEFRGDTLSISRGGTGKKTHTSNSVLVGNGTNALKNIASKIGAFFSTGSGAEPSFGTLPINCGGTGATTVAAARNKLGLGNTSGALPVANGGTGATTAADALKNLGITVTASILNLLSGATSNIQEQLNGKAPNNHGNHVPTKQTANNKVFLRNDNTWATVTPANIGAAATEHGYHIPTPQNADTTKFLRNDNTWQNISPATIGAAAKSEAFIKYNLNSINIDSTDGNWTVDISEAGHGTIPSVWVNVTQTTSVGHFYVQKAVKCNSDSNANRDAGQYWIRDKYNGGAWSKWTPVSGKVASTDAFSTNVTYGGATNHRFRYDPHMGMAYLEGSFEISKNDIYAGETIKIATLASGYTGYKPKGSIPLTSHGNDFSPYISTDGNLYVWSHINYTVDASYASVSLSGWWIVE